MKSNFHYLKVLLPLLVAVLLVLVACAPAPQVQPTTPTEPEATATEALDETPAVPETGANTVEVGLTEYQINMPTQIPAGPTEFVVTNNGTIAHSFQIEGQGISQAFDTTLQPGETRSMQVDLPAGTYTVICPVFGHAELGMTLELAVGETGAMQEGEESEASPTTEGSETLPGYSSSEFAFQTVADIQPKQQAQEDQPVGNTARPGGDLPQIDDVQLIKVADGLVDPINVVSPPDFTNRLFIVERPGRVQIVEDGELLEEPFMDISGDVLSAFLEQGLYDLEFHPNFAENGLFYIHYAELLRNGDSMIVQYSVSEDNPNQANLDSARVILQIDQPYANHNGGELAFGPDGFLYIGSGDGGWEGDPLEAGQDLSTLLGKVLRIDVNTEGMPRYNIPEDNPFADITQQVELFGIDEQTFARIHSQARPEIWAYGLRNPYKFSFDSQTGDLYLPDVGQNVWEEINFQPADSTGGENYGWDFKMGTHCFPVQAESCPDVGIQPLAEYKHQLGCAVIGVGVYRGQDFPSLDGIYFASDFCSGRIWGIDQNERGRWLMEELLNTELQITGAGEGPNGNLYLTSCNCNYGMAQAFENPPGALWQLVPIDRVPEGAETAPLPEEARATPQPQEVTIQLEAENISFDTNQNTVPAGAHVIVEFTNMDSVPHNFAVYETVDAVDVIFQGGIIRGPDNSVTYEFDAPTEPGDYFFRCDVHPAIMTGTFTVEGES